MRRQKKSLKKGFRLSELVEIYAQQMMPYVRRKADGILIRLDTYYNYILAKRFGIGIGDNGEVLRPTEQQEKLLKEVFGDRVIDAAPANWYKAEQFAAAEKMPHVWRAIPIHSRAEWLAMKKVEGMIRGIERYREVVERHNREAKNAMKPKGRRR